MLGLEDKVVLVTGGNHGIGASIVEVLEEFGAKVAYNYRSEKGPHGALGVKVDVTDAEGMNAFAEQVENELGPIYGAVANAGVIKDNLILRMPEDDWDFVVDVNLKGAFITARAVLPKMYERNEGSMVFISSLGGQRGNIGQANYAASKAGMIGLAQTIAGEAARYSVRCNVVAPGYTKTDIIKGIPEKVEQALFKQIPLRRFADPKEMAWAAAFFLSPVASSYVTGQVLGVNGGQYFSMTPSANFTEVWLRLMGDAMRGTADAQRAIRSLGEAPTSPDQMTRWLTQFMPGMSAGTTPAAMEDWLEDSWRMMGVVPRYRYLELLERHELLRTRLEKAEKEIRNLRKTTFAGDVPKQEAQKVLDFWENMLQETIQMQSGWIRSWTDNAVDEQIKSASETDSSDEGTSQKPKSE